MKKGKSQYKNLREELVRFANETDKNSDFSYKSNYSKKRKSTINKIRYKISNMTMESGDI